MGTCKPTKIGIKSDKLSEMGKSGAYTMRFFYTGFVFWLVACSSAQKESVPELPFEKVVPDGGLALEASNVDAGNAAETDAGLLAPVDSGTILNEEEAMRSENVIAICNDLDSPDGGFLNDIGQLQAERVGQNIQITVTLRDVNCGITEFNMHMEETENDTILKTTVSPVNLSNETPLMRCTCDMVLTAVYQDTDDSLLSVAAYFFSDVELDNTEAIPENGFMGEVSLQ